MIMKWLCCDLRNKVRSEFTNTYRYVKIKEEHSEELPSMRLLRGTPFFPIILETKPIKPVKLITLVPSTEESKFLWVAMWQDFKQ